MKKTLYILVLLVVAAMSQLKAQYAYFPQEGVVAFDKTVHVKNLLNRHINSLPAGDFQKRYFEELISKVPETTVLKKELKFKGDESSWEPVEQTLDPMISNLLRMGLLDYQNKAYQNLKTNESQFVFELAGSNVFVKDSLMDVKWKITNEYREIAGYECRRANGLVLDSVYVVAFYTEQIPTSSGPSNIHGLPGMILGLVVPEQHYNIYATKVNLVSPTINANVGGKKDKPITREEMKAQIKTAIGQWISGKQLNLLLAAMQL